MSKTKLFVILVILVVNLFDESCAKGGVGKNSARRKYFSYILFSRAGLCASKLWLKVNCNYNILHIHVSQLSKVNCRKKFGHLFHPLF